MNNNTSVVVAKSLSTLSKNEFSITGTLSFPELLKNSSNDESYEDVSYDVHNCSCPGNDRLYSTENLCS